jgi:phage terminase large subunit
VEGVTGMWLEEPTELTRDDFLQANLRLRGKRQVYKQIILSFNPISKLSWLYEEFFAKQRQNAKILRTTYKDNIFIDDEYIQELLYLAEQDSTYYQVYAEGEWGVLQNIIYSKFEVSASWPDSFDETIYGLDFGFNNQSALVEINWYDGRPFERELLYERKLTNQDLIGQLEALAIPKNKPIYADCAEPDRIQEIETAGYLIYPAEKRVKDGIDFVKRQRPTIDPGSVNLLKEIESYKWKEDRHGNVLDEPVKFRDHLMDARRYAYYTHARGNIGDLPDFGSLGGLGAIR